jgi:hypothetical protein
VLIPELRPSEHLSSPLPPTYCRPLAGICPTCQQSSGAAPSTPGARGARQWAHKTLYYGDCLFAANDRESSRIGRFSSGMRDSQTRCLAVETSNNRSDRTYSLVIRCLADSRPEPPFHRLFLTKAPE